MNAEICKPFPNTQVIWGARKVPGGFRGFVRTVEHSSWLTPCISSFRSTVVRPSREDAIIDATCAARWAVANGYVPTF